jgi:hypothetical protein
MRRLTRSEKTLFIACAAIVSLTGVGLLVRDYRLRKEAALEKMENLENRFTAAVAAAADAPFWKERQAWVDATMPVMGDSGKAHSSFLENLQATAKQRGLSLAAPVLLKPDGGAHHRELSISLQVSGPDNAVHRWLAELQSPEKFQLIKYLLLTPLSSQPPRMNGNVTVARIYKP